MERRSWLVLWALVVLVSGCFGGGDDSEVEDPVKSIRKKDGSPVSVAHCYKWPFDRSPPLYLPHNGVVVTKIMKPCVTLNGEPGYGRGTSWIAMGIPCTGGGGKVEWKGHYSKPKMVSFVISNSCPMRPGTHNEVKPLGVTVMKLDPSSNLLAYYPFSVHYWELMGYGEADTGFVVDLRTTKSLEEAWSTYRRGVPLHLKLYGRENAWVKGHDFFEVEVEVLRVDKTTFRMNVMNVRALSKNEMTLVRGRCEALRPPRNCSEVFN